MRLSQRQPQHSTSRLIGQETVCNQDLLLRLLSCLAFETKAGLNRFLTRDHQRKCEFETLAALPIHGCASQSIHGNIMHFSIDVCMKVHINERG
jgi:hypothetical protein